MIGLTGDLMLEIALKVNFQVKFSGLRWCWILKINLRVNLRGVFSLFLVPNTPLALIKYAGAATDLIVV